MTSRYDCIEQSELLGRGIRTDDISSLGTSSLTLFDEAASAGETAAAEELLDYFWQEMLRVGEALFQWMNEIFKYRIERDLKSSAGSVPALLLQGIRSFEPSEGDRIRALHQLRDGHAEAASASAELGRVRYAALHDAYVAWIQQLLTDLANDYGEDAVLDVVLQTYEVLWKNRYAVWHEMTPIEKLQLSVEGMRGHLSGRGRRGDVGIAEEDDRYTMILDPCGSCGILRRGDPDSGRPPACPASNQEPHSWTWNSTGLSWYSVHSAIVMEWIHMSEGQPPFRPLESCDQDAACRWYIYKDPSAARPEHYQRMGFTAPAQRS
jgi:hypothetical protein